tara:strand:- start:7124 stop:7414 length:291 start_codon:yes stop_codon:yes gene_type:complete
MAIKFDREKYQKMVNYICENVGGVLALYDPKPGALVLNHNNKHREPIRATEDLEEFKSFVKRYCDSYRAYPDLPILEFNEEFTLVYIKESYNTRTK